MQYVLWHYKLKQKINPLNLLKIIFVEMQESMPYDGRASKDGLKEYNCLPKSVSTRSTTTLRYTQKGKTDAFVEPQNQTEDRSWNILCW
jgi:hypothetical protein